MISKTLGQIWAYLDSLYRVGKIVVLIGALPGIVDIVARYSGYDITIPVIYYWIWFGLSILVAHFLLFRNYSFDQFRVEVKQVSFGLGKWHAMGNPFMIVEPMDTNLIVKLDLFNQLDQPTNVRIRLASINTDWVYQPITLEGEYPTSVTRPMVDDEGKHLNPFNIGPKEVVNDVELYFYLGFSHSEEDMVKLRELVRPYSPSGEGSSHPKEFHDLGTLSYLNIEIEFRPADGKSLIVPISVDISQVHKQVVKYFYGWMGSAPKEEHRTVFMSFYDYMIGRSKSGTLEDEAPWLSL